MAGIRENLLGCLATEKDLWKQRKGTIDFVVSPEKQILDTYIEFIKIVSHDVKSFDVVYFFKDHVYNAEVCINPLWSPLEFFSLLDKQLKMIDSNVLRIELQYLNNFFVLYKKEIIKTIVVY